MISNGFENATHSHTACNNNDMYYNKCPSTLIVSSSDGMTGTGDAINDHSPVSNNYRIAQHIRPFR